MSMIIKVILLTALFWATALQPLRAQDSTAAAPESLDSLIALLTPEEYDSLMKDLDLFLGDFMRREKSYFDVSMSFSNGFFTQRSANSTIPTRTIDQLVIAPSVGYYHKSGLGASWTGFVLPADKKAGIYQQQFTASYDYLNTSKPVGFGLSYTRQSVKDSIGFYASPFQNMYNAYITLRKGWLRPSLSLGYNNGSYTDIEKQPTYSVTYDVSLKDFTAIAAVRHVFTKQKLFSKNDYLMVTPRLMLIASGQKYRTFGTARGYRRQVTLGTVVTNGSTAFQPQSLGFNLSADYMKGKFYVHPQLYFDYLLQSGDKRLYTSALLLVGFMF